MKFILVAMMVALSAQAVEIVSENQHPACEELHLAKTLKLYKDPMLFVSQVTIPDALPPDSPLLTTLSGTIQLMRLAPQHPFRNFGAIAKIYELVDPKFRAEKSPLVVSVKVCGDGQPYTDTLGFVLVSELKDALTEPQDTGTLPPSTVGNPIPKLPRRN